MKKLWIYIYFLPITQTFEAGKPIKQPYVWSIDAPDSDYNEVIEESILIKHIKDLYYKYEVDGLEYFREIRAHLVLDYKQGTKTSADIFSIESTLSDVIDKLTRGDWLTAQFYLSSIIPTPPLDVELYDEISLKISNYIQNNY